MDKMATFASLAIFTLVPAVCGQLSQFVQYTPGGDDTLVERADPILAPNALFAHVHQVFGANGFSPAASYDSLHASNCTTVGDASGNGNAADKSSYWHPALYMESNSNTGYVRVPTSGHKIYYRDAGNKNDRKVDPFEFPKGFRMIAGDNYQRAPAANLPSQDITQWICHTSSRPWNQGTAGGFPNQVTDCDAYPGFNGAIHFPHCWNGNAFDQANPTAHMAYPTDHIQDGTCPSSHPIRLPHIFMENQFDLHSVVAKVKPNTFTLSQGDKTGYGWHADFFNGWDAGAIPALMDSCPKPLYGNEDVGLCSAFRNMTVKSNACKLQTTYPENVNTPGQSLPGCNPIISTNPAPKMLVAALGLAIDNCAPAGTDSDASGSIGSSGPTATTSSGDVKNAAPNTAQPPTSTAASVQKSNVQANGAWSESSASSPAPAPTTHLNSDPAAPAHIVWHTDVLTEWVTVARRDVLPTPAFASRHMARHIRGRGRRN